MLGHTELVDPGSAYSRPKAEGGAHGSQQQKTAMQALKKPLEMIPEKTFPIFSEEMPKTNKMFSASRDIKYLDPDQKYNVIGAKLPPTSSILYKKDNSEDVQGSSVF